MRRATFFLCTLLAVITLSARARAQTESQQSDGHDDPYGVAKLMLGMAGSLSATSGTANVAGTTVSGAGVTASDDARVSFGGGVQYMHPLHRYFVLGGLLDVQSWQSKSQHSSGIGRNLLFDLSLVPQGRFPVTEMIELYVELPVGLTIDVLNGATANVGGVVTASSKDTAVGYNFSALFGARFFLSKSVGLLTEVGYALHGFSHSAKVTTPVGNVTASADYTLEQLELNVGAFF